MPEGSEWIHEVKFDGYRLIAVIARGRARLFTRKGLDWTARFPAVAAACSLVRARNAVLDGEVVALLSDGRSSFQALQQAMGGGGRPIVYFAFDLMELDGRDLRPEPLGERKKLLAGLLRGRRGPGARALRYSTHLVGHGESVLEKACRRGLEGIVSKRRDAPYQSVRARTWRKIKCQSRQEFVVIGFTQPRGSRSGLGALLLGVHDVGRLVYAGKVGTGMGELLLRGLRDRLESITRASAPVEGKIRGAAQVTWVEPRVVVEVAFTEWTDDGRLRHPAFVGLREDKPAREVRRERPVA